MITTTFAIYTAVKTAILPVVFPTLAEAAAWITALSLVR